MNLQKQIEDYLHDRYREFDNFTISEIVYNVELMQLAKIEIENVGLIGEDGKANPAIAIYNSALRNFKELSTKLTISPQERAKLRLEIEKKSSFELDFN